MEKVRVTEMYINFLVFFYRSKKNKKKNNKKKMVLLLEPGEAGNSA